MELFTSWEGDQGLEPQARRTLTPEAVRRGDLEDNERQFCRIIKSID